ncbi:MAG: V4R domain-containing protein [Solibacillus isronensis]|uniref:V4R domain-containing protein n=1 Tax=Solibacillus isronensis TaxID=412383 RepID=UPI00335618AA
MAGSSYVDKALYTTTNTFGILRKELIESLGLEYAKFFLQRYGWNIGITHAKEVDYLPLTLTEKLNSAVGYHLASGQITDLLSERVLHLNPDDTVKYMYAKGIWVNSYEVEEHLKHFGQSDSCICHTLAGYSSGFTSYLTKKEVYIVEMTCRAKGDEHCAFEMRMLEHWDPETQSDLKKISQTRMIDDLNKTYMELFEEKKHTEKVSTFHNNLTLGISQGMHIDQILETIYNTLNIPAIVQDLSFNTHHSIGMTQEQLDFIKDDFIQQMPQTKSGKILIQPIDPMQPSQVDCPKHTRLISPIIVQKQIIGYISFIYFSKDTNFKEEMHYLQRSAVSISLCYLNEKSSLEATENIKAYFFEQLLQQQYTSKKSMISRSYLLQIDLNEDFYIGSLGVTKKGIPVHEASTISKIIQSVIVYLEMHQTSIFITEFQDEIVFLFPKKDDTDDIFQNILKHLQRKFRNYDFRIGLSRVINDIDDIVEAHRQAISSLNINRRDTIVYFENTNILGSLINHQNSDIIVKLAHRELEPILSLKPNKRDEFLKTLYTFLNHNGNLNLTMVDLNLSMSGLVYRIQKIEELLDRNLRSSKNLFELILLIESLIVLGEIEIE